MLAMLLALRTRQLIKASCRIFLEAFKVQYCRFTKYHFIDFFSKPSRYLSDDLECIQKRAMRIILPHYKYREALKGGAYYCYCACVLRISRYWGFPIGYAFKYRDIFAWFKTICRK